MIKLPPPSLTHPPSPPTLSIYISTCFIFIPPYCLLPPSLRLSLSVLYASLCCRSPPSISVCFIFISLLSLPPFSPLSLSLTEREIININVSLFFSPSLSSLFHFFYLSFTTDLFSAPLFIPLSGSLSLIIAFTQPSLHLSPSLSLFFLSLFSALCSCSVFIYYCSVDNSLLCLQPYSHLSD